MTKVDGRFDRLPRPLRRALPRWVQGLILLTVFVSGGAVGAMATSGMVYSRMQHYRAHPEAVPRDVVPRLQRVLQLNERQVDQVRAAVTQRHARITALRAENDRAVHAEFQQLEHEVAQALDARQRAVWSSVADSIRRRFLPPPPNSGSARVPSRIPFAAASSRPLPTPAEQGNK